MEKRKVISLGKSSFAIILPKEWILEHEIKGKDEIYLITQPDGKIVIQKEFGRSRSVSIDKAGEIPVESLERVIRANYLLNVDEIRLLVYQEEKMPRLLTDVVAMARNYHGMNLSFTRDEIKLTCLLDMENMNILQLFEELHYIFKLLLSQIQTGVVLDSSSQASEADTKYCTGIRLLNHITQHSAYSDETNVESSVKASALHACLCAFRTLITSTGTLLPELIRDRKSIPDETLSSLEAMFPTAMDAFRSRDRESLARLETITRDIEHVVRDNRTKKEDARAASCLFLANFLETTRVFLQAALFHHYESKQHVKDQDA